jgi:hypothetical protein
MFEDGVSLFRATLFRTAAQQAGNWTDSYLQRRKFADTVENLQAVKARGRKWILIAAGWQRKGSQKDGVDASKWALMGPIREGDAQTPRNTCWNRAFLREDDGTGKLQAANLISSKNNQTIDRDTMLFGPQSQMGHAHKFKERVESVEGLTCSNRRPQHRRV